MSDLGLVSIIMPLYNSEKFLSSAIESVISQTYKNWELILIDDKSTDNSLQKAMQHMKQDSRIKLIELQDNSGPAIARNTGIKAAKGKYIAFLDSDDMWLPEKLELQIKFMNERNTNFSYTAYRKIDEDGENRGIVSVPESITYNKLLNTNIIGCLTAIYNAEKLGKIYMPNIIKRQDYALWLKILKKEVQAFGLNIPLAIYRVRKNSVSSNKLKAAFYQWKIYREIEQLNIIKSLYHFINYMYYGFMKYRI
jgi:teichuronic acid biosynthesis glycosyltransferase TuaG